MSEAACRECRAVFVLRDRRQLYCTKTCKRRRISREWSRRNPRRVAGTTRCCERCFAWFVAMRKDKRYCSESCCKTASAVSWARKHPDRARANRSKYSKSHPDVILANKHRRRAREKAVGGSWRAPDLRVLRAVLGTACLAGADHAGPITWDHITPIALGGGNDPLNLQPLCRRCNSRKSWTSRVDYRSAAQKQAVTHAFADRRASS